ncbi:THAP domain-containing protein 1-like isoform X2 [Neodiprion fabricii]|uniref:THAP domain-containing protein 1-like isoform X2 n=1 Tax=Neodiprion fabricii TaxID=2872261 RepID=UPI001ED97D19|nr:THAP domain-containing protein 1-like isoform X2 [Neodiprion fabricii]XP_046433640.1 THAP domain-containing protein 1-like isoform X2 [Neodiprion fabricii]
MQRLCQHTKFPVKDVLRLQQWLKEMKRKDWKPNRNSTLCSAHFTNDCFDRTGFLITLKKNSVPTIFDNPKSECSSCHRLREYGRGYSFFKFPLDEPDIMKQWIANFNIGPWSPSSDSFLCSDHFEPSCFQKKSKNYITLRKGSIPTLFGKNLQQTEFQDESDRPTTVNVTKLHEHLHICT